VGEKTLERVKLRRPEPLIAGEPAQRLRHRGGVEPARDAAPALAAPDQPRIVEHVEMLEHRRQRHGKGFGERRDAKLLGLAQPGEHRAPGRIGKRGKDAVEAVRLIVNHQVKLSDAPAAVKPDAPAGGKWRNLLKQAVPSLTRAAVPAGAVT